MPQTIWQSDQATVEQGLQDFGLADDKPIAVDITDELAVGETPTSVSAVLWQLGQDGAADVTFPTGLVGTPTTAGNIISQRVSGLTGVGRIYKLVFTFGATGNRRSVNAPLRVVE